MCGGCPGGNKVSKATAKLNHLGVKRKLFAELQRGLASGCSLTLLGDQWTLRLRTGRLIVYPDIEQLIADLHNSANRDWTGLQSPKAVLNQFLSVD